MALFYGNNNTVLTIAGGSGTNNLVYNYGPVTKISGWVGLGTSIFGNNLGNGANGIAYARNRWITVGQGNNTIAYSDNGISWTPTGLALFVYGNGDSIIGLNLWTDPDATGFPQNFTILSGLGGSFTADQLVTYLNSVAIVGIYGVSFSWDPIAYRFSVTNNQGWYIEISFTDSQLGFFALSFPPYTQTVVAPNAPSPAVPPIFTTAGTGVSASPTQWIATGLGTNSLAYSTNGIDWTGIGTSIFTQANACEWNPSNARWVVVGSKTPTSTIAYSADGVNWTSVVSDPFDTGRCVATAILAPNLFGDNVTTYKYPQEVMTSDTSNGYTSSASSSLGGSFAPFKAFDGITTGVFNIWTNSDDLDSRYADDTGVYLGIRTTTTNLGVYSGEWIQLDLNQSIILKNYTIYPREGFETTRSPQSFVLVGRTGSTSAWTVIDSQTNLIWAASTPKTFTITSPTVETTSLRLITLIVGNASEPVDKETVNITEIEYNAFTPPNKMWVAGGEGSNTLAYSNDGITWTGSGASILSNGCFGVAWNGKLWVAVGSGLSGEQVATSTNGISWISRGAIPGFFTVNAVCWNGSFWVVAGEGGIAYSTDGINWTSSSISIDFSSTVASRFSVL